jgi:hypothetical protein
VSRVERIISAGVPWSSSAAAVRTPPPVRTRLALAGSIALGACILHYIAALRLHHAGDFGIVWFGARALFHGANPYVLVGPGLVYDWQWNTVLYPATAMVVAAPFALLPQLAATLLFVWLSTALLAYAITADGWYRLPLFLSSAFIVATFAAQWSPLLTAALCIPSLAWVFAAKPNLGLALLVTSSKLRPIKVAMIGGLVLLAASVLWFPGWPMNWLAAIRSISHMHAPIMLPGGAFILLALLRWRRPEARLIIALACVPQTNSWYEALPLFLVPATYRESLVLSLISVCGWIFQFQFMTANNEAEYNRIVGILMVAFIYLPATALVLRRSNNGGLPGIVEVMLGRRRSANVVAAARAGEELFVALPARADHA